MRVLRWLVIAAVAITIGAVGVGFMLPDAAHIERSAVINARPATVYTVLNGFRQFNHWSPWAELDPDAEYLMEGPPVGVGARQSWRSSDSSVGAGSQEIIESVAHEKIVMKLVFEDFDSDNLATYTLLPDDAGTRLTWSYDTRFKGNLLGRYFGLMLDGMLGPDYERGLTRLKALVESLPRTDLSDLAVEVIRVDAKPMLHISAAAVPDDSADVLTAVFARLTAYLDANGLVPAEPFIAITRDYDVESGSWRFDGAVVVDRAAEPSAETGIRSSMRYGGLALKLTHSGSNASLEPAYARLQAYRSVAGFTDNGDSWEQYLGDATTPPGDRVTLIYWPVK